MMTVKEIDISKEYGIPGSAKLNVYLHEITDEIRGRAYTLNRPAMIVVPGGGYAMVSDREGEPIALDYFNRGYNVFVLYYDVAPYKYPTQITQLACSIDYLKKHAEELSINPDNINAVGFSAGGHIVGSIANNWKNLPQDYIAGKDIDAKLKTIGLAYPLIIPYYHNGSFKNLIGRPQQSESDVSIFALQDTVNEDNPPCFIWTTAKDTIVPPLEVIEYAKAYLKANKRIEFHMWPTGEHGSATSDGRTNENYVDYQRASEWLDLYARFIEEIK